MAGRLKNLKGYSTSKKKFFHLPTCRSEPIKALFAFETQFKIFWIKNVKLHCQGPEKYEKHRQNTPSAISGLIWLLWSDKNTFCTEIKQK